MFDKSCFYSVGFILHRKEEYTMRKINKTKNTGLKVSKLLDLLLMEKEAKLLEKKIELLRQDSGLDTFMCTKPFNEKIVVEAVRKVGEKKQKYFIELMHYNRISFDQSQFRKDNPKLYEKYRTKVSTPITRKIDNEAL